MTGIDSAQKMLDAARANAADRQLDNVEFKLLDWNCVMPGQNLKKHDVVISSRNPSMFDVEKLTSLANRMVALQIFADAPSIPALIGVLFSGCGDDFLKGPFDPRSQHRGEPAGLAPGPHGGPGDQASNGTPTNARADSAYIKLVRRVYDAGYDPNVRILPERFRKSFRTREAALEFVCSIKPDLAEGHEERVALNAAPFITQIEDGFEFCIATSAALIWWDVRGCAAFNSR